MKVKKMKKLALNKVSISQLDNFKIYEVKNGLQLINGGLINILIKTLCNCSACTVCTCQE